MMLNLHLFYYIKILNTVDQIVGTDSTNSLNEVDSNSTKVENEENVFNCENRRGNFYSVVCKECSKVWRSPVPLNEEKICCQIDENGFDPVIERFKQLVGLYNILCNI